MYFNKYADKTDGAIRGFDVKSTKVKIICLFFVAVCILFAIIAMFPAIWVFLSGFKDLRELTREATLFPKSFNFSGFKETLDCITRTHLSWLSVQLYAQLYLMEF